METITLNGSPRTLETKKEAQNLRREGNIPCVLYGGEGNQHFFADERQLAKLIFTPNVYIVKLNVDGKEYDTVIRDIQFHPVTDKVIHVDFFQLFEDRKVDIRIPVVLNGTSIGVKNGGRLRFNTKLLKIRAFPSALLDKIDINIEKLKIGDSVKVQDLSFAGLEFLDSPNRVVTAIKAARLMTEIEGEEEAEEVDLESMSEEERAEYDKAKAEKEAAEGEGKGKGEEGKAKEGEETKKEEASAE